GARVGRPLVGGGGARDPRDVGRVGVGRHRDPAADAGHPDLLHDVADLILGAAAALAEAVAGVAALATAVGVVDLLAQPPAARLREHADDSDVVHAAPRRQRPQELT